MHPQDTSTHAGGTEPPPAGLVSAEETPRPTLRSRLLLLFSLAAIPAILVNLLINYSDYRLAKDRVDEEMLAAARSVALRHQQMAADSNRLLELLVQDPEVRSPARCRGYLARTLAQFPVYANFAVASANGDAACSAVALSARKAAYDRGMIGAALGRGDLASTRYHTDAATGSATIDLAHPLRRARDRAPDAALVATLRLDWFYDHVRSLRLPEGATAMLVDARGTILGHYPQPERWVGSAPQDAPFVRASLGPESARLVEVRDLDGRRSQFVSRALPAFADEGTLRISIAVPASSLYAGATGAYLLDLAVLLLGALTILATSSWGSQALVLKPIHQLLAVVRRQKAGDPQARAEVGGVLEFAELATRLNEMFDARSAAEKTLRDSDKARTDAQRIGKTGNWSWDIRRDRLVWAFGGGPLVGPFPVEAAMTQYIHPDERERFRNDLARAIRDKGPIQSEYRWRMDGGPDRVILITGEVHTDEVGQPVALVGAVQDVTARKRAEEALRLSNSAIEHSSNGIMIADARQPDFPVVYVNPALLRTTGYALDEVLGRNARFLQGEDRDQPGLEQVRTALRERREIDVVLRNYRKDGTLFWNQLRISPVTDAHGNVTHVMGIQNDITEMKTYEAELERQANFDSLTGLPNRNLLTDRLTVALAEARRFHKQVAVLWLNIDRFQRFNESMGRTAGDFILKVVGERLQAAVRESDTVARMGSDQYAIGLPEVDSPDAAAIVARKVSDAISLPLTVSGQEVFLTCSIGIAMYPHDAQWVSTLLANAEIAMARSKGQIANYGYYAAEMNSAAATRLELEAELRHAIARDELLLHYQPRIDLATGAIRGVEALIRWQHPRRGLVPPSEFIPLAEETGLIVPMGAWILDAACRQARAWRDAGHLDLRMAINLSPRQFRRPDLAADVQRVLRDLDLPAANVELEITESMAMDDPAQTRRVLQQLKAIGVSVAVDDFGTGHSSLGYLSNFPLDFLKIDQSFVRGTPANADNAVIVRTVIALAHNLSLEVIAEGVETEEQRRFLEAEGCEEAQGYLFSRPLPAAALEEFLRAARPRSREQAAG